MSTKVDLENLTTIRKLWPDFTYPKEAFLKGDLECVTDFYQRFIREVNENLATLTNDPVAEEVFEGAQAFDPSVDLYCKVGRILKKLKLSISLCDLLGNSPKRNLRFMRIAIHFLIYLNNWSELVRNVVAGEMSKVSELEELLIRKKELIQEIANNAELLSEFKTTRAESQSQLVQTNKAHEKMLEHRKQDGEEKAEKLKKLEQLIQENSNMECEGNCLSHEELELKNNLVTDEEYEGLRKVERSLELEQERLSVAESDLVLDSLIEERTLLTNSVKILHDLNLDNIFTITAKELTNDKQLQEQSQNELRADLKSFESLKDATKKRLEKSQESLEEIQTILVHYEKELLAAAEKQRNEYENKTKTVHRQNVEAQTLKKETANQEKSIQEIENDIKRLNSAMAKEYNKILQSNKRFCDDFHTWLLRTRDSCQS